MAKKGKNLQETMAPKILNRKARHDYHVDESFEVGIMLTGPEVKSVRMGRVSLAEAFGRIEPSTNELWILNLDIAAYDHAHNAAEHEPKRKRKLLAKRREIQRLYGLTTAKGVTLVPLAMYFNDRGIAKLELAVATGKQHGDKRDAIKKKDADKRMKQAMTRKRI